jgi:hypothetical protein
MSTFSSHGTINNVPTMLNRFGIHSVDFLLSRRIVRCSCRLRALCLVVHPKSLVGQYLLMAPSGLLVALSDVPLQGYGGHREFGSAFDPMRTALNWAPRSIHCRVGEASRVTQIM